MQQGNTKGEGVAHQVGRGEFENFCSGKGGLGRGKRAEFLNDSGDGRVLRARLRGLLPGKEQHKRDVIRSKKQLKEDGKG